MTLMLDLPETTMRWLQSEAAANGKDAAAFVGEQLAEVRARAEAQAILNGPFHALEEADQRFREKHNVIDLSRLSREELAGKIDESFAQLDPQKWAEAERQGLL